MPSFDANKARKKYNSVRIELEEEELTMIQWKKKRSK